MAIIKQFDKRSGITYVYDSKTYYDKDKKCSREKRTLIGKLDPVTGEIIPTDGRNKGAKNKSTAILMDYTATFITLGSDSPDTGSFLSLPDTAKYFLRIL